jgi:hypothetical protein
MTIRIFRVNPLAALAVFVTLASAWIAAAPPKLAPDVTLQNPDGSPVPFRGRGKVVLVDFWAAGTAVQDVVPRARRISAIARADSKSLR